MSDITVDLETIKKLSGAHSDQVIAAVLIKQGLNELAEAIERVAYGTNNYMGALERISVALCGKNNGADAPHDNVASALYAVANAILDAQKQ